MNKSKGKFLNELATLKQLWSNPEFIHAAAVSPDKDFTRCRSLDLKEWLYFYLQMNKATVAFNLSQFLPNTCKKLESLSPQAFSKARIKVKPSFFLDTLHELNKCYYDKVKTFKTWNNYRLVAIDGSKCIVPNTKELREHYGVSGCTNTQYPSASCFLSTAYDVLNHRILDVAVAQYKTSERSFVLPHVEAIKEDAVKNLLLFDRGYVCKELIYALIQENQNFLFRLKIGTYAYLHKDIESDGVIFLPINDERSLKVRILKSEAFEGQEPIFLLTNVFDESLSSEDMKDIYLKRWGIESSYDVLKNKLQMINYTGRTPVAVQQDIYRSCLLANLLSCISEDANEKVVQKKQNKYCYKININHAIGVLFDQLSYLLTHIRIAHPITDMIRNILRHKIPIKPDRHNVRRERSRKVRHHQNSKSNI
ncbi:MAG: hypothetical protein RLZZ574_2107 [Cyanobacteriota bacterium]